MITRPVANSLVDAENRLVTLLSLKRAAPAGSSTYSNVPAQSAWSQRFPTGPLFPTTSKCPDKLFPDASAWPCIWSPAILSEKVSPPQVRRVWLYPTRGAIRRLRSDARVAPVVAGRSDSLVCCSMLGAMNDGTTLVKIGYTTRSVRACASQSRIWPPAYDSLTVW